MKTNLAMKKNEPEPEQDELTEKELDVITTVFRSYETGLREATILPKVHFINEHNPKYLHYLRLSLKLFMGILFLFLFSYKLQVTELKLVNYFIDERFMIYKYLVVDFYLFH